MSDDAAQGSQLSDQGAPASSFGPQALDEGRAGLDEATIVSWQACAAIAILLVAMFFTLPHL